MDSNSRSSPTPPQGSSPLEAFVRLAVLIVIAALIFYALHLKMKEFAAMAFGGLLPFVPRFLGDGGGPSARGGGAGRSSKPGGAQ